MGCNRQLRGWVWRGGDDTIRATCCLISSLLISCYIFYISDIFSLMILFLKNVCTLMCRELKGSSSDVFFIEKANIKGIETCDWSGQYMVWIRGQPSPAASEQTGNQLQQAKTAEISWVGSNVLLVRFYM